MLKLNARELIAVAGVSEYSNTTLVKVKFLEFNISVFQMFIQIQLLLKLNARKISICDFHYTIKSIDIQGYWYFLPAIMVILKIL